MRLIAGPAESVKSEFKRGCALAVLLLISFSLVGCGGDPVPPDVAGRYALRVVYGDAEEEGTAFVWIDQKSTALSVRDEISNEVIGTGTVTPEGSVTIDWVHDDSGELHGRVMHVTTTTIPNLTDSWTIQGNAVTSDSQGLRSWRLERMDQEFQVFLGSAIEEEEQMQGAVAWLSNDAPGDGHQQIVNAGLLPYKPAEQVATGDETTSTSSTPQGAVLECKSQPYSETRVAQLREGTLVTDDLAVIFPGSVLQGRPLAEDGAFLPVSIRRAGGKLFLQGLMLQQGATYSRDVAEITAANTSQAINEMLTDNVVTGTAANFIFNTQAVYSYGQAMLALGVDAKYGGASMKSNLNIDSSKQRNYVLATFTQVFYTVAYEKPLLPEDVFRDGGGFADPNNSIHPGNPPLYISSVNYGRQVYFLVESTETKETIEATLEGAYKGFGADVKVDAEHTYKDVMRNSKVTYWVRGGAADLALQPIREATQDEMYDALRVFLSKPDAANFSSANPGMPVSYTVKYLLNDRVVAMNMSAVYERVDCHVAGSATHAWRFRYEGMNYRTTAYRDGTQLHTKASGTGKETSGNVDFSIADSDDHTMSFVLSNGDCFSSGGTFIVRKDGLDAWKFRYAHGWGNCGQHLKVEFKFNNRAGGQLTQEYCEALRGARYRTGTTTCPS